jgi:biopolymer transport protein ExbB
MLSHLFLGLSLVGAEWVLYLLVVLSVVSVALIVERALFYRSAAKGSREFREKLRGAADGGRWADALDAARRRAQEQKGSFTDLEAEMAHALLASPTRAADVLGELAQDAVMRARLSWERNLSVLASIGSNAPFIGLFGTVLGIIKAFHDLSQQAGTAAVTVTAGISEALVATAIGLLVAIPAAIAFNLFQRRVRFALTEAEALKSFLVGKLSTTKGSG